MSFQSSWSDVAPRFHGHSSQTHLLDRWHLKMQSHKIFWRVWNLERQHHQVLGWYVGDKRKMRSLPEMASKLLDVQKQHHSVKTMNRSFLFFVLFLTCTVYSFPFSFFFRSVFLTIQSESPSAPAWVCCCVWMWPSGPQGSYLSSRRLRQCCGSRWSYACGWEAWCGGGAWVSQVDKTGGGGCKVEEGAAEGAEGRRPLWHARAWTWPIGWADG